MRRGMRTFAAVTLRNWWSVFDDRYEDLERTRAVIAANVRMPLRMRLPSRRAHNPDAPTDPVNAS